MRQVDMTRLDLLTATVTKMRDYVAVEIPLKIILNDVYSFVIWSSPSQFKELAIGYLCTALLSGVPLLNLKNLP